MKTTRTNLLALATCQILLGLLITGTSHAVPPMDGDWPGGAELWVEEIISGNPLKDGDRVFGVSGWYRFVDGRLGLQVSLGVADPESKLVTDRGRDGDLRLVDFSVVWYPGYPEDRWPPCSRIKPEWYIFGGPGLASLEIDGLFPNTPPRDDSESFFTVNAGAGVRLYRRLDDGYRTSRMYLSPEVTARWFTGQHGEVDWGVGLAIGYSFGKRPTCGALALQVRESRNYIASLVAEARRSNMQEGEKAAYEAQLEKWRAYIDELAAHAEKFGRRCPEDVWHDIEECRKILDAEIDDYAEDPD